MWDGHPAPLPRPAGIPEGTWRLLLYVLILLAVSFLLSVPHQRLWNISPERRPRGSIPRVRTG